MHGDIIMKELVSLEILCSGIIIEAMLSQNVAHSSKSQMKFDHPTTREVRKKKGHDLFSRGA